MSDVSTLLADYVQRGSDAAFRDLVGRYTDLVYSTALRLVNGDAHAAQDIAQTVFIDLARKAAGLSREVSLGGWLHRHTCFVAATALRGQRRRQAREQLAVAMNAQNDDPSANVSAVMPFLDDAINQLNDEDRAAIHLRFFEQLDFRAVGARLGSADDAARMRVNRALEKLHTILKAHGVTFSAAVLGTILAAETIKAAPAGLAATFAGNALAALAPARAVGAAKLFGLAKLKFALAAGLALALMVTPLILQHQRLSQVRAENKTLRSQLDQSSRLQAEDFRLRAELASNHNSALTDQQVHELARLRAEVGRLRDQTNRLARAIASAESPVNRPEYRHGKRVFRSVSMDQFADYLTTLLCPPPPDNSGPVITGRVTNATGLTGTYDIAITPPQIGPESQLVQRTTYILKSELGLDLVAQSMFLAASDTALDAFTNAAQPKPVSIIFPQGLSRADEKTVANYSLRWQNTFTPFLKPASNDPDPFGLVQADSASSANVSGESSGVAGDQVGVLAADDPGARNACINNLRLIDASKQQWALEKGLAATNIPAWEDITPYIPHLQPPQCPSGGTYIIGSVGDPPKCSIPGHSLQ